MSDQSELKRIYWHSRRGMLELDLVLMPFAENHYAQLSAADQAVYKRLLACEDQDLFAWFLQHREPEDPEIARMVARILHEVQASSS